MTMMKTLETNGDRTEVTFAEVATGVVLSGPERAALLSVEPDVSPGEPEELTF